jgi:hypothetical protein
MRVEMRSSARLRTLAGLVDSRALARLALDG